MSMDDDDQDIYDVAPAVDRTVSDLGKLRSMFEQKPMPVYTPGKPGQIAKQLQTASTQPNRNAPALKPKPGKIVMPQGFQSELQSKQKQISNAPVLPKKDKRLSIDINGDIVRKIEGPPSLPKKGQVKTNKPVPPVLKEKPKLSPRDGDSSTAKLSANQSLNSSSENKNTDNTVEVKPGEKETSPGKVQFGETVEEFEGEVINTPNGEKYRLLKFAPSPDPAPAKQPLPRKIDILDILQQYAEDDDLYDDVVAEDPNNRVSVIPEFTEAEEKELARLNKKNNPKPEEFEQEEYDDVRVSSSDRKNKSISIMSTESDIYETFDDVADGDVKL